MNQQEVRLEELLEEVAYGDVMLTVVNKKLVGIPKQRIEKGEAHEFSGRLVIHKIKRISKEVGSLSSSHGKLVNLTDVLFEISPERKELIPVAKRIAEELLSRHTSQFHRFPFVHPESIMQKPNWVHDIELADVKGAVKEIHSRKKNWEVRRDSSALHDRKEGLRLS